jgi:tRNA(Ile2) C34 agmatinyltransferase TiaS
MSAAAVYEEQVELRQDRVPWPGPRGIGLAQLLARAHEDVQARGMADCPACGGVMERAGVQATCASCGSRLS